MNAGEKLKQKKAEILATWESEVRVIIPQAANESHPVLIDTLPKFLDTVAESLSPSSEKTAASVGSAAQEHGGERARLTNYTLDNLFLEYIILREAIFEVLNREGALTPKEQHIIRSAIDDATKQAALSFTLVLEGIRQQFMATLTHDLRGPLTAAKANIEMILRYPEQRDRHPLFAVRAVDNLNRADKMITDLLDVSRVQAGEVLFFEMVELDAVKTIRRIYEELVTIYGDRFNFHSNVDMLKVWWNFGAIHRVLENLASNAVKYGAVNTPISLELKAEHDRVILSMHNVGQPIPVKDQETLFHAFKRTSTASRGGQQGWGLGLALVRGVAEAHGGSIMVESTLEKGTLIGIDILQDARDVNDKRS